MSRWGPARRWPHGYHAHHLNSRGHRTRRRALRRRLARRGRSVRPRSTAQHGGHETKRTRDEEEGYAAAKARHQEPDAIEAAFPLESYRPGATAALRIWTPHRDASVRIFRVGPEPQLTVGDKRCRACRSPPAPLRPLAGRPDDPRSSIGDWPSGLYFAKLTAAADARLRAVRRRAASGSASIRVAIVLPTRTWQAYNFRDDDGDGKGDTWYALEGSPAVRLGRPFLNRGVPPHFRNYDLPFLRWLHEPDREVDVLSQAELDGTTRRAGSRRRTT